MYNNYNYRNICNCSFVNLMTFFGYEEPPRSELASLIANEPLEKVIEWIKIGNELRIIDKHGNSPLHLAVIFQRKDIFTYLLQSSDVEINARNRHSQTSLHLGLISNREWVITPLIEHGADVNLPDNVGCTPLHVAATGKSPKLCQMLLDNGANINHENMNGETALTHACQHGNIAIIHVLLFYGATVYNTLALAAIMWQCPNMGDIHEILYFHTFAGNERLKSVNLCVLTSALLCDSPLFPHILGKIETVTFDKLQLLELSRGAIYVQKNFFRMLIEKFCYVVSEMVQQPSDFHYKITTSENVEKDIEKFMEFLTLLFDYKELLNLIRRSFNFNDFLTIIMSLYNDRKLSMATLTNLLCFFYSYGMVCELADMALIYENCGFCDLFKCLLSIVDVNVTYENCPNCIMTHLICQPLLTFDRVFSFIKQPCWRHRNVCQYFYSPKFRALCDFDEQFVENLPPMCSLLQLARDVARKFIIREFHVEKSRDFYMVISRLPINGVCKKILTYEKPIYHCS